MNVYRIAFANNEVVSCNEIAEHIPFDGVYSYEHINGKLIYALIKADTEDNAITIAYLIIKEVTRKVFGSDFVY